MAVPDPYASAKAALRDNVKTLTAVYSAVTGVILAGTPFSGFGSLAWGTDKLVAAASLLAMALFVGLAVRKLLTLLRPDLVYVDTLRDDFPIDQVADPVERAELSSLREEFGRRKGELLPKGVTSIETYQSTVTELGDAARRTGAAIDIDLWKAHAARLDELGHWAAFRRLHRRIGDGMRSVMGLGIAAMLAIFVFAWFASAPKAAVTVQPTIVFATWPAPDAVVAKAQEFQAVYFETDSAALSAQAIERIAVVRDHLRAHPAAGVLIYGHTDTQGSERRNAALARQRADVVASSLLAPGGIAASRVLVAPVGPMEVPILTGPQVDNAENRSARFVVFDLPPR